MPELLYEKRDRKTFLTALLTTGPQLIKHEADLDELIGAIEWVRASESVRFLVIRGAGETFCVGDDPPWFILHQGPPRQECSPLPPILEPSAASFHRQPLSSPWEGPRMGSTRRR